LDTDKTDFLLLYRFIVYNWVFFVRKSKNLSNSKSSKNKEACALGAGEWEQRL
jgi:hypothetical protein